MKEGKELACCQKPDWRKLNTGLIINLHNSLDLEKVNPVLIEIDVPKPFTTKRTAYLKSLGVYSAKIGMEGKQILTGQLTIGNINRLTHRPWVSRLSLSRMTHLLTPSP